MYKEKIGCAKSCHINVMYLGGLQDMVGAERDWCVNWDGGGNAGLEWGQGIWWCVRQQEVQASNLSGRCADPPWR